MKSVKSRRGRSGRVVGSLQIRHSQESDEGKYECVAENSVGVAYSYAANLYVRGQQRSVGLLSVTDRAA